MRKDRSQLDAQSNHYTPSPSVHVINIEGARGEVLPVKSHALRDDVMFAGENTNRSTSKSLIS